MRLATWNCQTGLETNWGLVEALNADVLTVQECGPGMAEQVARLDGWTCEYQAGRWGRGLGVLATPHDDEVPAPTRLSGAPLKPTSRSFWAAWYLSGTHPRGISL